MTSFDPIRLLEQLPGLLMGFTVHEYMHARMAYALGDSYAKEDGRLTLNPVKHIDMLGFILLMTAGIGWAKPVGFDPSNFKKPKRDEILVAMAGPFSNLVLAFLMFGLCKLSLMALIAVGATDNQVIDIWFNMLIVGGYMNLGLFVFNLIPLPPLDGSHLYMPFLHETNQQLFYFLQKYGFSVIFVLILADNFLNTNLIPIYPVVQYLAKGIMGIVGLH